jgi:PAS domain-containing protein
MRAVKMPGGKECNYYPSDLIDSLLKNSHNIHEIIHDSIDGVWIISPDQTTLFANQKLAEILGYTPNKIQTKPFWNLFMNLIPFGQRLNANQFLPKT